MRRERRSKHFPLKLKRRCDGFYFAVEKTKATNVRVTIELHSCLACQAISVQLILWEDSF